MDFDFASTDSATLPRDSNDVLLIQQNHADWLLIIGFVIQRSARTPLAHDSPKRGENNRGPTVIRSFYSTRPLRRTNTRTHLAHCVFHNAFCRWDGTLSCASPPQARPLLVSD